MNKFIICIYLLEPLRRTVYPKKLSNNRDERNHISQRSIQIPGSHKSGGYRRQGAGAGGFDTCGSRNSGSSGRNRFSGNLFDVGNRRLEKLQI